MGLVSKITKIKWNSKNKRFFEDKGYPFTKMGEEFIVKVEDLSGKSSSIVNCECDHCEAKLSIKWANYTLCVKDDGKYYCIKCSKNLFGSTSIKKTLLKKSISFEQWCVNNNHQDILDRWDYELNDCIPNEITYRTKNKFWFRCPCKKHQSELKSVGSYTRGREGSMSCSKCNSIAQWGIDKFGEDFLDKYWDYEKNSEIGIDPWETSANSHTKIWFVCQEKTYHNNYFTQCNSFTKLGTRCPLCFNTHGKVHELDSLNEHIKDEFDESFIDKIWSVKNIKSPSSYSPKSHAIVWWKCPHGIHDDFKRDIKNSNIRSFRCPKCEFSKGEKRIENFLVKNNINFIPQKRFKDLLGLGKGIMSYDFYLVDLNVLIEYQGEQHDKPIDFGSKGVNETTRRFNKQKIHDELKREYARQNNYKLIEIWYYDFDNIEEILSKELNKYKLIS